MNFEIIVFVKVIPLMMDIISQKIPKILVQAHILNSRNQEEAFRPENAVLGAVGRLKEKGSRSKSVTP
jgi:hypothetical protein